MSIEVKIPALGESISGILSSWKVAEGSYVEVDQPIYELETDKITQEGLAEVSGVISIVIQEGEEVEIGATIAKIDESVGKADSSTPANNEAPVDDGAGSEPPTEPEPDPVSGSVEVETEEKAMNLYHPSYLFLQPFEKSWLRLR